MLSIHVGQAGIQIGSACWERFATEHGINVDGSLKPGLEQCGNDREESLSTFFEAASEGRYVPRFLLTDLEPSAIGTPQFSTDPIQSPFN